MTIQRWAQWIEFGEREPNFHEALDIKQVPQLIDVLRSKFKGLSLYSGLIEIVQEFLPVPELGFGFGKDEDIFLQDRYTKAFYYRVQVLPLRDGEIFMNAQAFRIALIGKQAFMHSNRFYELIFYDLSLEEKKYVLAKQPNLLAFRTNLPQKIGSVPLEEILCEYSPKDILYDAALFGSDALLEAIIVLKQMIPVLCIEEAKNLERILHTYPLIDRGSLSYLLICHQLQLLNGEKIFDHEALNLVECLNIYCGQPDAHTDLYILLFPELPLKRAQTINSWIRSHRHKVETVHIPLSPIAQILTARRLELSLEGLNSHELMTEFDFLEADEKKEFILKIILEKKIEILPKKNRNDFLNEVETRKSQPFLAIFKLALLSIGFTGKNAQGQNISPQLHHTEVLHDIQRLEDYEKIWFVENLLTNEGLLALYFQSGNLSSFFNMITNLRNSLPNQNLSPLHSFLEDKILELCPVNLVSSALHNLGRGGNIFSALKNYVLKNITIESFEEYLALTCKRFFDFEENGIDFLLAIAVLQYPSGRYLLSDPDFLLAVPEKYKQEIRLLIDLIEPFDGISVDPLQSHMKSLPKGLKELLVREGPFSSFFHQEVMARLLNLYKEGCIPDEEMFYLATRLPYEIFMEVVEKCPVNLTGCSELVWFGGSEDTIQSHLQNIFLEISLGDPYAEEDLCIFLNRYAKRGIGEGRYIQYLAHHVPRLFNSSNIQKIFTHIPMNLVPHVAHILDPINRNWFLNPHFEAIFTKNIGQLSIELRAWLFDNLEQWFPIRHNIVEHICDLWERPTKCFEKKLEIFEETKTLLILFQKRFFELATICQKLSKKPDTESALSIYRKIEGIYEIVDLWLKNMEEIDLSSISDVVTDELLKGEVYSLESNGWILKSTKDRLTANPFTTHPFKTIEEKNKRVLLLNSIEMADLEQKRQQILSKIETFRTLSMGSKEGKKRKLTDELTN
jgi:hypothetical protein